MILVDYREDEKHKGSPGLWQDLQKTGLSLQQDKLDGGDLMFLGAGPGGREVTIGVEFKKLNDLLSSLRSQRLQGHQLFELQHYDFRFLLVEGRWAHDDAGRVAIQSKFKLQWHPAPGGFSAAELDKTLLGLTLRAGVVVKETQNRRESVRWITSLYRNFNDVGWEDHTSHTGVFRPATLIRPSPFRNFIMGIPTIGAKTSKAVEEFFTHPLTGKASPRRAVAARAHEWQQIDGVGKKTAASIDAFLEGE